MEIKNILSENPFFSVCIPQYNRTSFLLEACRILKEQTYKDFELCIADDLSTDGREEELIGYLEQARLSFTYKKNDKNLRYDGNLRASISMAKGRYCFLHGNDDSLKSENTLKEIYAGLVRYDYPEAVITNYEDWATGEKVRRIQKTRMAGSGPEVAARHFRNLSFVSGVIIDRTKAQYWATDKWDGSEMYQMFIVSRIVASGGFLLELDIPSVKKNIQLPDESVDSYATRPKIKGCKITERIIPLVLTGRLVADALLPYLDNVNRDKVLEKIFTQLYIFPYFFWLVEYRRVQSWNYAAGVCIGMRPANVFLTMGLGIFGRVRLCFLYIIVSFTGLLIPVSVFDILRRRLYYVAKKV